MIDLHSRGIAAVIFSINRQGFVLCHFIFVIFLGIDAAKASGLAQIYPTATKCVLYYFQNTAYIQKHTVQRKSLDIIFHRVIL